MQRTREEYARLLSKEELDSISSKVVEQLDFLSKSPYAPTFYTYCDECPPSRRWKTHCITSIVEGTALCPSCWAKKRELELMEQAVQAKKPKLDLADFARV